MSNPILRAEPRTVVGKKVRRLRREGFVPGIVYGPVIEGTVEVQIESRQFDKFYWAHGHSTLATLEWGDRSEQVFVREVQLDPVRRTPLHIDFFAPNLTRELTAVVPIVLHHHASSLAGTLNQIHNEIEVRGLPTAIPSQIDGDISGLIAVGDVLRVGDLTLPEGISLALDADEVIATVTAQVVETEETEEETEVATEEAADAASGDDGGGL